MPMNKTQINALVSRITEIASGKINAYKLKNKEPSKHLTDLELYNEFKAGRYKVKKVFEPSRYSPTLYDFVVFEEKTRRLNTHKKWVEGLYAYQAKVNKEKQRIIDIAYFGDAAEALEMIKHFEDL